MIRPNFKIMVILCVSFWMTIWSAFAQNTLDLMPYPADIKQDKGRFRLTKEFDLTIKGDPDSRIYAYANRILRRIDKKTGLFFYQGVIDEQHIPESAALTISIEEPGLLEVFEDESYTLHVSKNNIEITAPNDLGAMRGLETLVQLVAADEDGYYFPALTIEDQPRFTWRGLMIDGSRNFQPVAVLKRNLDAMAAVKLNVFHFHLSDDQGFRFESKKYPRLQEVSSDGQYYTQEQIRDIVQYASDRGIRVIPEIDIPGHGTAIITAYPELGSKDTTYTLERNMGVFNPTLNPIKEETYTFLDGLLGEVAALFPDEYVHIGGDENAGKHWRENEEIQAFMKKHDIPNLHLLQNYMNVRVAKILKKYGKRMMGWEEILTSDTPKSALIHSWRGANEGAEAKASLYSAARQGFYTILSNGFYIDLMHDAADHYKEDILPEDAPITEKEKKNVLGGEATMWSELVSPVTIDSRIWPRTAAIAERFWSPRSVNDVDDMYRRLDIISRELELNGLYHIAARAMILRNLAKSNDFGPLETLVRVSEPLENYQRNPGGTMYKTYSPLYLFADACNTDAADARYFNHLTKDYLAGNADNAHLMMLLNKWEINHELLLPMIKKSPMLKEIEGLSQQLSDLAKLTRRSIEIKNNGETVPKSWFVSGKKTIENARRQGGRTELDIVDDAEKIFNVTAKQQGFL